MKVVIKYGLYPFLLFTIITLFTLSYKFQLDYAKVFAWMGAGRFVLLLTVEYFFPMKPQWKMTWKSFYRDLKWAAIAAPIFGGFKLLLQVLTIDVSANNTGILSDYSIFTGFVVCLLTFEFFQYWYHRLSHTGKSPLRKWLWKVHVAHHLPKEVYLLMHVVGHPINAFFTLIIVQGSLLLVGARPESIFLFSSIMGLQGLVSHFNVEIKSGFLNYVLVGTELHRFHHSANLDEAKNYGAVTPFWDMVFGTYYYKPKSAPVELGVANPELYPTSTQLFKVLKLPFK